MNHCTKRLVVALLCSISIHLAFIFPDQYITLPKKILTSKGSTINLKIQNTMEHPTPEKTVSREKSFITDGFMENKQDYYPNITVPTEITDIPAKLKKPLEFDKEISENIQSVKLKIWVSQQGTVDKVELLDEIKDPYAEIIKNQILLQEFEPAIYKGKKVNSLLIGEIFLMNN